MQHNLQARPLQCAEDFPMPNDDTTPRDTFRAPVRSSGRMAHMPLAFELVSLAMRCRVSHPDLSAVLEELNAIAIGHQRADDHQLTLLKGGPVGADSLDTDDDTPHPLDAPTLTAKGEAWADVILEVVRQGEAEEVEDAETAARAMEEDRAWVEAQCVAIRSEQAPRGIVERVMAFVRGRAA